MKRKAEVEKSVVDAPQALAKKAKLCKPASISCNQGNIAIDLTSKQGRLESKVTGCVDFAFEVLVNSGF